MPIRMTGLNSGLDTESIVAALMSAQRTKQTKVENKKTKLEWKKEAWASLNTKIMDFYKGSLSKIKMQANYRTKAATSSNTSKVTAKATTSAATGNYSIKVQEIASAQSVVGGKIKGALVKNEYGDPVFELDANGNPTTNYATEKATSKSKLVDLVGSSGKTSFTNGTQIKIEAGGKEVYLDVDEETTIQNFLDKLKGVGLNASFDEKQQRLFVSSNKSGKDNYFKITSGEMKEEQKTATKDLKDIIGYNNLSASNKAEADKIMAALQGEDGNVDDAIATFNIFASDYIGRNITQTTTKFYTDVAKKKAESQIQAGITDLADDNEFNENTPEIDKVAAFLRTQKDDKGNLKYNISKSDEYPSNAEYEKAVNAAKDDYIEKETKRLLATEEYKNNIENTLKNGLTKAEITAQNLNADDYKIEGYPYPEDADFVFRQKDATDTDTSTRDDDIQSAVRRITENYETQMSGELASTGGTALASLGLKNIDNVSADEKVADEKDMAFIAAKNTKIEFNGAIIESETTNISVAGLELNILSKTATDETINISVTNDTSAVYDTIKDFITEYNSILKEMSKYYNAGTAKGYNILTDEEKQAMSDADVEKWEGKIKDSLLRRDTTLGAVISSFKNSMMGVYTSPDGKRYSLSSLGITTSKDYKEGGLLHIQGDEDDSEYADSTNLLKKMLSEDPDKVANILSSLSSNLYQDLQKKMGSTKLSGAMTFYNDKEMSSQLSDYKKDIAAWQEKLNKIEDRYYKQFTAMEKALAGMQSQQNSLANLMGSR